MRSGEAVAVPVASDLMSTYFYTSRNAWSEVSPRNLGYFSRHSRYGHGSVRYHEARWATH